MSGLEKLKTAADLIEIMTGCRFKDGMCGAFISSDEREYLGIDMRKKHIYKDGTAVKCKITFDASIRTMGHPMDSKGIDTLLNEVGTAHALLLALEMDEYVLTIDELDAFNDYIRQRDEQTQIIGPAMG